MLVSDEAGIIEEARFLSQQARDPAPHYEHSRIGFNYRMSNIVAAIGRGQLRCLPERVKQKRCIFEHYRAALSGMPGISFMPEAAYGTATRWLTVILVEPDRFGADRETIRLSLEKENIESRPVWKPMHLQPAFNLLKRDASTFPVAPGGGPREKGHHGHTARVVGGSVSERLFAFGLCLPSGTAMTESDLERVVGVIKGCQQRNTKRKSYKTSFRKADNFLLKEGPHHAAKAMD